MSSERARQKIGQAAFGIGSIAIVWLNVSYEQLPNRFVGAFIWLLAMLLGACGATEICPRHCDDSRTRRVQKTCLIIAYWLLMMAVSGLALVGDRVAHALYELYKFAGFGHEKLSGISLGANVSFIFLSFCLLATGACMLLALLAKDWNNRTLYRFATAAGTVYFVNGTLMLLLIMSGELTSIGLATLDCGR